MSTDIGVIKNSGSRKIDMTVTRYWGGDDAGTCVQLTAMQEDGTVGYVQLSKKDFEKLTSMINLKEDAE